MTGLTLDQETHNITSIPHIPTSNRSLGHKIINRIFSISNELPLETKQTESEASHLREYHFKKVLAQLQKNATVTFVLPAFPAKSPNREKTISIYPDMGEIIALKLLNNLCLGISRIYTPGAKIIICSDGRVFSDLVMVNDDSVDKYAREIRNIIKTFDLKFLETFNLEDVFPEMRYDEMRQHLVDNFAVSIKKINDEVKSGEMESLFNGIHRFIFEDRLVLEKNSYSKNKIRQRAKEISYQVIQRSNAWSKLVEKLFPEALRLSIHPQPPGSKKIGIKMLDCNSIWGTPWHNVAFHEGNNWRLITHKDAITIGGEISYYQGKYPYYTHKRRSIMGANTKNLSPFGILYTPNDNFSLAQITQDKDHLLEMVKKHKIVLFRGFSALTKEQLLGFCANNQEKELLHWDFGPVMEMKVSDNPKNYLFSREKVPFHWDGAFHKTPSFLVFNCIEAPTPGSGGETLFCNTTIIWNTASQQEKELWPSLHLKYETEKKAHYGGKFEVSMVENHPLIDEQKILRFAEPVETKLNPVTMKVKGMSDKETQKFIRKMQKIIYSSDYCYQHQWQEGDLMIVDNHGVIHGRNSFTRNCSRHLRRIQIL